MLFFNLLFKLHVSVLFYQPYVWPVLPQLTKPRINFVFSILLSNFLSGVLSIFHLTGDCLGHALKIVADKNKACMQLSKGCNQILLQYNTTYLCLIIVIIVIISIIICLHFNNELEVQSRDSNVTSFKMKTLRSSRAVF